MMNKLFVFVFVFIITVISVSAQETPPAPPAPPVERMYRTPSAGLFGGSYLGVQTVEVTKENFSKFGLGEVRGVAVEKVLKDSPAEKAGLQNGDVIVRFDGESVTSVRKLTRLIGEVAPDHKVNLTVLRNGSERDVQVTVGKREVSFEPSGFFRGEFPPMSAIPDLQQFPKIPNAPMAGEGGLFVWRTGAVRQIGVTVSTLTKQLGDYFGISDGTGLLINDVRPDSPAAKAGLKAGDVIIEIDGRQVKGDEDLMRGISDKKDGAVNITVVRDKNRQVFSVVPNKISERDFVTPKVKDSDN